MPHQLTIHYADRVIRRGLDMPIGEAHIWAEAIAAEFFSGAYALNESYFRPTGEGALD